MLLIQPSIVIQLVSQMLSKCSMWVCVYVYIHTVGEQIKKLLYQLKTKLCLKTVHIQLAFHPLFWNATCSRIKMLLVIFRTPKLQNFLFLLSTRHNKLTPNPLILWYVFLSFKVNNGMIQFFWCRSYLLPNIQKYILPFGIVFNINPLRKYIAAYC